MQVVILCGGTGTRLKEQTEFVPKPMVQIGGKPMVWHIMKHYAIYGHTDFILALGYKQEVFKHYFRHFVENNYDVRVTTSYPPHMGVFDLEEVANNYWDIVLADTGENTLKGGRIKRIEKYSNNKPFMLTYGDAVSNVNLDKLLRFHESHGKMVTITGVEPEPRFGELLHANGIVSTFKEKPKGGALINGGFMICQPEIFGRLNRNCDFEKGPLEQIAADGELMVYHHRGRWKCMDTLNDMIELQRLWDSGEAWWETWKS